MTDSIAFEVTLEMPYDEALEAVEAALKEEGFGILTRIDVRKTFQEKLGESFRPYAILGACNPQLAHKALQHRADVGILLPCNVTVEDASADRSTVRIGNPEMMMGAGGMGEDEVMREVASEALARLERVARALAS